MNQALFAQISLILFALTAGLTSAANAADERHEITVKDLSYGVALYELFQQKSLLALQELDVGEYRNALTNQPEDAELLRGGLYVTYGLTEDAERIFNDLLEKKTDKPTQDRIWFNLARIEYNRGNYPLSSDFFSRIEGELPAVQEDQKQYLLTSLHIQKEQFGQAARSSDKISDKSHWKAYTQYNLGIALKQNWGESKRWLSKLTQPLSNEEELLSLADTSHLALGLFSLQKGDLDDAISYTSKVRSSGPLSNKALLATGWAWSKKFNPDRALTYWQALADKNQPDGATQEALLAIPYAYEQKGNRELAALMYNKTAVRFDNTLNKMDEVIASINGGELLDALRSYEIVEDQLTGYSRQPLPLTSATPYLHQIFADKTFQLQIQRYQELLDIRTLLQQWENDLPAFELMLKERRKSFEAKRPLIEKFSGFERLKDIQKQRDALSTEVVRIELLNDYMALANEDEREHIEQLNQVRSILRKIGGQQDLSEEKQNYRLMSGLLQWELETEFPARYWRLKRELHLLDRALNEANESARSLQQASVLNAKSLDVFDQRIDGQLAATQQLQQKVDDTIFRQEQYINQLAIQAMQQRKQHLARLRLNARFSQVRLYDELLTRRDTK